MCNLCIATSHLPHNVLHSPSIIGTYTYISLLLHWIETLAYLPPTTAEDVVMPIQIETNFLPQEVDQ